jgi:hypothetical protein
LFRGLPSSDFKLETTLERNLKENKCAVGATISCWTDVEDYLKTIKDEDVGVEKISKPSSGDIECWITRSGSELYTLKGFEFLCHLRQYGLPSPLLDWTMCPSIAAAFAFKCDYPENEDPGDAIGDTVAIYMMGFKMPYSNSSGTPSIRSIGNACEVNQRHARQMSQYTMCIRKENGRWTFSSHEDALHTDNDKDDAKNHKIVRFVPPRSERKCVSRYLSDRGITARYLYPDKNYSHGYFPQLAMSYAKMDQEDSA